jgi:glutamate-1-semialdehyde 2,1-aminomutase
VAAGREMQAAGWWTLPAGVDAKVIGKQLRKETLSAFFGKH